MFNIHDTRVSINKTPSPTQDESAMLPKFLAVCVPLVFDVARSDKDREIVCCALECINEMLKEMKGGLVSNLQINLQNINIKHWCSK